MIIDDILRGMQIRVPFPALLQQVEDRHLLMERIERTERRRAEAGIRSWAELAARPAQGRTPQGQEWQRRRLQNDVQALCRYLLTVPGVRRRTGRFAVAEHTTDPAGARGLGCLIYLTAGNSSGAQFWWRYAAGIGDATAAYLLVLEALLRGDRREAAHCYRAWGAAGALYDEDLEECTQDALTTRLPFPENYLRNIPIATGRGRSTAEDDLDHNADRAGHRTSGADSPETAGCPLAEQGAVGRPSRR
ncbi:hypothetical protein AB0K89_26265 [Streptomyces cinnamoneus]|uniref:hypothetical protein n=1 Tax=Streptomyces cinnamoneus TaxID=53446 RepID=UPI0034154021